MKIKETIKMSGIFASDLSKKLKKGRDAYGDRVFDYPLPLTPPPLSHTGINGFPVLVSEAIDWQNVLNKMETIVAGNNLYT